MLRIVETATEVLEQYRTTTEEDFKRKYKIFMNEDGSIFDRIEKKRYNNLSQWAKSLKEKNQYEYS